MSCMCCSFWISVFPHDISSAWKIYFLCVSCLCFDVLCLEHLRLALTTAALRTCLNCPKIEEGIRLHPKAFVSGTGRSWWRALARAQVAGLAKGRKLCVECSCLACFSCFFSSCCVLVNQVISLACLLILAVLHVPSNAFNWSLR